MKFPTPTKSTTLVLLSTTFAATISAQTTQNPLVSLLSQASAQLKSVESVYSTTDIIYESLLSVAASRVSQATASLATNPSSAQIYSSLVSEYSSILNGATATAAANVGITGSGTAAGASVSGGTSATAVSSRAGADTVRVGALGAVGMGVFGLAAFL